MALSVPWPYNFTKKFYIENKKNTYSYCLKNNENFCSLMYIFVADNTKTQWFWNSDLEWDRSSVKHVSA